nr:GGDEF domain-containing protein [uncultured Cedecea sp.]
MTSHIWHTLLKSKHMLSLCLFILLNGLSAVAVLFCPFYSQQQLALPVVLILVSSIIFLSLTIFYANRLININIAASFYGLLWASQLIIKNDLLTEYQHLVLMMSLLSVLLIATLSFINNIYAFVLYCLPVYLAVFWLDNSAYGIWLIFPVVIPALGITIQYQIQKRHTEFNQRLMNKFQEERERLSDLSMLDPLTGLYNRRGFQHRFDSIMAQGKGNHFILLLDIDRFKAYNDHYGHTMGDQTLTRVSAAIRDAVRAKDIVARYGGEEFLVMLTDIQSSQALQTAERIRQYVYDLNIMHQFSTELDNNITISIGITPLQGDDIEQAILLADQALYKAKNHGRNKILPAEAFDL